MNVLLSENASASQCASARQAFVIAAVVAFTMSVGRCEPPHVVTVEPGTTQDLYFQFNLSGNVYVKVGAQGASVPCADFWWITWPLGTVESLGRHCGFATFTIPGWTKLAVSSKLRVGGTKTAIKVGVFDNVSVAHSWKFDF